MDGIVNKYLINNISKYIYYHENAYWGFFLKVGWFIQPPAVSFDHFPFVNYELWIKIKNLLLLLLNHYQLMVL